MATEEREATLRVHNATQFADQKPVSRHAFLTIDQVTTISDCFYVIGLVTDSCGILTNVWNIIVFKKMGVTDSVTFCLLTQAVVDLLYATCVFVIRISALMMSFINFLKLEPNFLLSGIAFSSACSASVFAIYDMSIFTTVYINVQKCCCVALPLHFKSFFTLRRSCVVILILAVYVICSNIPNLMYYSVSIVGIPRTNKSALILVYNEDVLDIRQQTNFINRTILSTSSYVVVLVCSIVMAVNLRKSVKFRQSTSTSTAQDNNFKEDKNMQIARSVFFTAILFLFTNLPRPVFSFVSRFAQSFTYGGYHFPLILVLYASAFTLESLNASTNFFVYFRCSSRFRSVFTSTVPCLFQTYTRGANEKTKKSNIDKNSDQDGRSSC